jgi:WD40 repeat protein
VASPGYSFRSDGKVLAAGGESKVVQVFDVQHKTLLRQLSGHAAAVRAVRGSNPFTARPTAQTVIRHEP